MLPRLVSNFEAQANLLPQPLGLGTWWTCHLLAIKPILGCFYQSIREILTVTGSHTLPHSLPKKECNTSYPEYSTHACGVRVSLCSSNPPASASCVLGLKACAIKPSVLSLRSWPLGT